MDVLIESKVCKECAMLQPLSEFYRHAAMADGHLNKCKNCVKNRVKKHRSENIEKIREYDRKRGNLAHRIEARKAYQSTPKGKASLRASKLKYSRTHPKERAAQGAVAHAVKMGDLIKQPCEVCATKVNVQAHHDNYNHPLDVRWLCPKHHSEWHKNNEAVH